jgi:hypothetical protein
MSYVGPTDIDNDRHQDSVVEHDGAAAAPQPNIDAPTHATTDTLEIQNRHTLSSDVVQDSPARPSWRYKLGLWLISKSKSSKPQSSDVESAQERWQC